MAACKTRTPAKKSTAVQKRTNTKPAARKNPAGRAGKVNFDGACKVSLTANKIVVTRKKSMSRQGQYVKTETRNYYDRTPENMQAFDRYTKGADARKIDVQYRK